MSRMRRRRSSRAVRGRGDRLRQHAAQRRPRAASAREVNPYETPYRPFLPPTAYAMAASRHMHQYGTTREQLAAVAVAARQWALLNPAAWEKEPLSDRTTCSARG